MHRNLLLATLLAATTLTGCASPLSSSQKAELDVYRLRGLEVQEKNPATGAALGILPGGGSFYARNYGLGIVNLLLWPVSVLWDPISGRNGAESINYQATKTVVGQRRYQELKELDNRLSTQSITPEAYTAEKARIETRYSPQL